MPGGGYPSCLAIELSERTIRGYADALDLSPERAFTGLVHALAANLDAPVEPSAAASPLTLLARPGDLPALAWIGSFDPILQARLQLQMQVLEQTCAHLRYVGFPDVERACRQLAAHLTAHVGREELAGAHFTAIPNGGFVVLGLLASLLGVSRSRLAAPEDVDSLLVVVDDCAVSGFRFREFLGTCRSRRIVFAPLLSPPPLRTAIQAAHPCILACHSGADLRELPVEVSSEHRQRRQERLAEGDRYWIGSTEPLCFPWNEPDRSLWNPVTGRYERTWHVVPPELCLKNGVAPGRRPIPVQMQPAAHGRFQPGSRVLFAELGGEIVLCSLNDERVYRLGATGSTLWRGGVVTGHLDAAIRAIADGHNAPEDKVRRDAERFFSDLVARGFLTDTEN